MIRFYKTAEPAVVADVLSEKITKHLSQGSVLWLIGGGSVEDIAINAALNLASHKNIQNLTITCTDERFGAIGHADSNWQQLLDKGFLLTDAVLKPVLRNLGLTDTVKFYSDLLEGEISTAKYSIALGGIGADGHIVGIKPHSPAVDSQNLVVGYKWQDYTRITPTIQLIKRLDEIIIYAAGNEKHHQLDRIEQEVSAQEQPAQLLKQAKNVTIYNDYKGEKL